MKKVIPLWLCISLIIGMIGLTKIINSLSLGTEFPLFVDIQIILFLVPCFSLVFSTLLFILFLLFKSRLAFITVAIVLLIIAIISSNLFFNGFYETLGLIIINFEFFLFTVLHFYISAVINFFITKKLRTK